MSATPATAAPSEELLKFPRDTLAAVADDLATVYEARINAGNVTLESTTAYAARFIRAYLAAAAAPEPSDLDCWEFRRTVRHCPICEPCNTGHPELCLYKRPAVSSSAARKPCLECNATGWVPVRNSPTATPDKFDEVLLPFLSLMRKELHANTRKGDRPGWLKLDANTLLLEIYWHTAKLSAAVKNNDGPAIMEHSADVANMAMMLLDAVGGLAWASATPLPPTA